MGWAEWTSVAANVTTIVGFVAGGIAAAAAGRKYFSEKRHERVVHLYGLANALFRAELTIQHHAISTHPVDPAPLVKARAELKNWYYDNRFLFENDARLKPLIEAADDEAAGFVSNVGMDHIVSLKKHLEVKLSRAP
ncbi:MAG: hypothetical protein ACYC6F_19140 [Longimicrobiales bacterium]